MGGPSPEEARRTEEDRQIVESFVDASNRKIRAVNGYSQKLRPHVRQLYNHVLEVADAIPAPIELSATAFGRDPLVNALFADSSEIEGLFRGGPEADSFCRAYHRLQVPVMYGLMTAAKTVKRTLGVGMQGDVVVHDVPQDAVNFSQHKIHAPCASATELHTALRHYLFNRVVESIRLDLAARMNANPFAAVAASYETRVNSLANPDVYVKALLEYLEEPAKLLSIEQSHLKLSKLGIKLAEEDRQCANEFDLHELAWSNHAREVVALIAYPR